MRWKEFILYLLMQGAVCRFVQKDNTKGNENDNKIQCLENCKNSCCTDSCLSNCSPEYEMCDVILAHKTENLNIQKVANQLDLQYCDPNGCECM